MKIKLNGTQLANVKQGFTLTDRLDEELDTGVIIALNGVENEYPPFSIVEVFITSDSVADHTYLVDTDESMLTSKDLSVYMHTMTLVEPTKLEERYMVDNIAFTQPTDGSTRYYLDDVLTRINDITPLEVESKHADTRLFSLDSTMLSELSSVASPQFYFNNQNFRQAVDETLRYVSSISRIRSFSGSKGIITRDNFNTLKTVLTSNLVNKGKTNSSEYFANEMDMQVENGVSGVLDTFPDEPNYMTFTSEDFIVTTNDVILKMPKQIYKLEKLVMMMGFSSSGDEIGATEFWEKEIDITSYVYEEELYQLLTIEQQKSALRYKKGENKIVGFGTGFPTFLGMFPKTVIEEIYDNYSTGATTPTFSGNEVLKAHIGFRVYYYPYISQRIRAHRAVPTSTNRYQIPANQSAKALDITRLLNNAQGTINRLGNGDLVVENAVSDYANRLQVGQYTTDGYVVTSVEHMVRESIVVSKAVLTKNFNRLSQFIGVDRDYRQYTLPLNETVNRNLYYEEFVTFSPTPLSGSTPMWASDGINMLRYMFDYSNYLTYGQKTIKHIIATTKNSDKDEIGSFLVECSKSVSKNSNAFHFQFESNNVAFYSPSDTVETPISGVDATSLRPVYYTEDGIMEYMTFALADADYFKSLPQLVPYFANITLARAWYATVSSTYLLGIIVRLGTPFVDYYAGEDGIRENESFDYVVLKPSPGSAVASGIYEQDALEMLYHYDNTSTNDYIGDTHLPKNYRLIPSEYVSSSNAKLTLTDLVVKKDPSEVISMTYQLHFIPTDRSIIIGQKMMENSPFIKERYGLDYTQRELYLYRGFTLYKDGDTKCIGTRLDPSFTSFINSSYTNGFVLTASGLSGYNSWAIGDYDGNLYIGVNRTASGLATNVFVQFKNKL